ncbi:MAG: deoxyribose-phosphate aldolase [Pirellulaceae bacterium]|nr:deoxyribose-phosphate aldolase [Pirellulaceae bacterium]
MMWTRSQIAKTLDHAVLKPFMTDEDIVAACEMGKRYGVASVCVRPSDVALAARELAGSGVVPSTVIGFPHGANLPETKALEARLAIEAGARELDMVMNIGKFLSGDCDWVRRDIEAVVAEARKHPGVLVKVILETCYLSPQRIAQACTIAQAAGADFVKTSTGFGDGPATPEAVQTMKETVGGAMGIKPSGGIRDYATACRYLDMGVQRLGVASTEAILKEAPEEP